MDQIVINNCVYEYIDLCIQSSFYADTITYLEKRKSYLKIILKVNNQQSNIAVDFLEKSNYGNENVICINAIKELKQLIKN